MFQRMMSPVAQVCGIVAVGFAWPSYVPEVVATHKIAPVVLPYAFAVPFTTEPVAELMYVAKPKAIEAAPISAATVTTGKLKIAVPVNAVVEPKVNDPKV